MVLKSILVICTQYISSLNVLFRVSDEFNLEGIRIKESSYPIHCNPNFIRYGKNFALLRLLP